MISRQGKFKGIVIAIAIVGLALSIGMPKRHPSSTTAKHKGPQCVAGEYLITKSVVAPRDDKALQIVADADPFSYRLVDQSRSAMLVRDVEAEPDKAYMNEDDPSPVDGHEVVDEAETTLCDSVRRHARSQRRANGVRVMSGEPPLVVRRVECGCNHVIKQQQTQVVPTDPKYSSSWQYTDPAVSLHPTEAWAITTGSPQTVVAVVDSGIDYNHPDLVPNLWVNPNEIPGDKIDNDLNGFVDDVNGASMLVGLSDIMDFNGHGTHVAGIIAAAANNNVGTAGLMWKAGLMAVRVFDSSGSTTDMTVIKGIDYVTLMKSRGTNIAVGNYSLGGDGYSSALYNAFQKQSDAGVALAVAAGNDARSNDIYPSYPANFTLPGLISVAALARGGYHDYYSNWGKQTVHVSAPGGSIFSTWPTQFGSYATISGTSMASPHVAGVLGLMYSRAPSLSPAEAANILINAGPVSDVLAIRTISGRPLDAQASVVSVPAHTSSISGTVLRSGSPLSGAAISFANGAAKFSTSTNSSGAFTSKVRPGTYVVTPFKPRVDFSPRSQTVTVSDGGTASLSFTATDQPYFNIGGKIVSSDSIASVAGVSCDLLKDNISVMQVWSGPDGVFEFPLVPPATYTVRVSAAYGQSVAPASQVVTVTNAHVTGVLFTLTQNSPVILEGPASLSVGEGGTANFSVKARGQNVAYAWLFNNATTIPGATSASYSIANVSVANAGLYSVIASNAYGRVRTTASLEVVPSIVTDLKDVTITEGVDAEFSLAVKATGGVLHWYVDGNYYYRCSNSLSCMIPTKSRSGVTSTVRVSVMNSLRNTVYSRTATLKVLPPPPPIPVILGFYPPTGALEGGPATFLVSASGTGITYQWLKNGAPISGATTEELSLPSVAYEDSGTAYSVVVTNAGGSVRSDGVLKVWPSLPVINELLPASASVKVGSPLTFSVKATGRNLTYQWFFRMQPISGATSSSYTFPSMGAADSGGDVKVVASNESGSDQRSALVIVKEKQPPVFSVQPNDQTGFVGQAVTFTVGAYGVGTYQWYRDGVALPGQTGYGLTLKDLTLKDSGAKFFVEISNADGTVRSSVATLSVSYEPVRFTQPLHNITLFEGWTARLEVNVDVSDATFAWYRNDVRVEDVSGTSYTFPVTAADDGTKIRVIASASTRASAESVAAVTVQLAPLPQVLNFSVGATRIVEGDALSFNGYVSGTADKVRIYRGDVEIPDSSSVYYSKTAKLTDSGTYFARAWIGSRFSDSPKVSVIVEKASLTISRLPASVSAKIGQSIRLTARTKTNMQGKPVSYQWLRNGVPISSETSAELNYRVKATDAKAKFSVRVTVGAVKVTSSATSVILKK